MPMDISGLGSGSYTPPPLLRQEGTRHARQLNNTNEHLLSPKGKAVSKLAKFADAIVISALKTASKAASTASRAVAKLKARRAPSNPSDDAVRFRGLSALKGEPLVELEPRPPQGVIDLLTKKLDYQPMNEKTFAREAEGTQSTILNGQTLEGKPAEQFSAILENFKVTQDLKTANMLKGHGNKESRLSLEADSKRLEKEQENIANNIRNLFQVGAISDLEANMRAEFDKGNLGNPNTEGTDGDIPRYLLTSAKADLPFAREIKVDRENNTTTFILKMPYPVKDTEEGTVVGYCGCYREITISNEDLAKNWAGEECPPSLRSRDQTISMQGLESMLIKLGHPQANHPPTVS